MTKPSVAGPYFAVVGTAEPALPERRGTGRGGSAPCGERQRSW